MGDNDHRQERLSGGNQNLLLFEKIAFQKRASRARSIPQEWHLPDGYVGEGQLNVIDVPTRCAILTDNECEITNLSATELLDRLLTRRFSSYEVTLAFCKRAAIAQQLVSFFKRMCITRTRLISLIEGQLPF